MTRTNQYHPILAASIASRIAQANRSNVTEISASVEWFEDLFETLYDWEDQEEKRDLESGSAIVVQPEPRYWHRARVEQTAIIVGIGLLIGMIVLHRLAGH